MMNKKYLFMLLSIFTAVTYAHADENSEALPKGEIIHRLEVDPMPIWEPKTLEEKIKESSFILIGTPVRFRFISEEVYKKHYSRIKNTPEYIKLKKEKAPFEAFQKYFDENPGSLEDFRFYDDDIIGDLIHTFIEFKIYKIMFKYPLLSRIMDIIDDTIYFPIGGEYRKNMIEGENNIKKWKPYLGKKVIMLSGGYSPINDTAIRMPFVQHRLVTGYHPLDKFPTLISERSDVESIAKSLGYVRIELTPSIYKKRQKKDQK